MLRCCVRSGWMRSVLIVCLIAVLVAGVNASPSSLPDVQSRELLSDRKTLSSLGEQNASLVVPCSGKFNFTAPRPICLESSNGKENMITLVYGEDGNCNLTMKWNQDYLKLQVGESSKFPSHRGREVIVEVDGSRIIVRNSGPDPIIFEDFGCVAKLRDNDNTDQGDCVLDVSIQDAKTQCFHIDLEFFYREYEAPTTAPPTTFATTTAASSSAIPVIDNKDHDDESLTSGAIVGIILGCVAFLLLFVVAIVICCVCCCGKRRREEENAQAIRGLSAVTCEPRTGSKPVGMTQATNFGADARSPKEEFSREKQQRKK